MAFNKSYKFKIKMYHPTLLFFMSLTCLSSMLEEKNTGITILLEEFRIIFVYFNRVGVR